MERYSILLSIKEIEITTTKYYYTATTMVKIVKTQNAGKDEERAKQM